MALQIAKVNDIGALIMQFAPKIVERLKKRQSPNIIFNSVVFASIADRLYSFLQQSD